MAALLSALPSKTVPTGPVGRSGVPTVWPDPSSSQSQSHSNSTEQSSGVQPQFGVASTGSTVM